MKCPLCDTENGVQADCCSQCQMPLLVRECPACDALVGKSASRCPRCGGLLSPVAGHSQPIQRWRTVTPEVPAAPRQPTSAPSGETQRMDRLAMRIKQLEGELAASRIAAAPSPPPAPVAVPVAAPIRVRQRKPESAQSGTASRLILGGLLFAVVAGGLYQFQGSIRRQLEALTTSLAKVSSKPAVATDSVPLRPATTPAAALASAEEPASTLAAQAETSNRAGAEPREVVPPAADAEMPEKAAAAPALTLAPVPNADPPRPATAPEAEADKPVPDLQIMPVQTQAHASAMEEAVTPVAAAAQAGAPEPDVVPAPNPRPTTAYDCSSAAVAALGLCEATH